jgi:hypothetical protein
VHVGQKIEEKEKEKEKEKKKKDHLQLVFFIFIQGTFNRQNGTSFSYLKFTLTSGRR